MGRHWASHHPPPDASLIPSILNPCTLEPPLKPHDGPDPRQDKLKAHPDLALGAMEMSEETTATRFSRLVEVMACLRGEGGCPWDREQTHTTLKRYLVEETYEVLDAIDDGDDRALCDELGDVLLQVVFHAQMAKERGAFDIGDVVSGLADKLIRRHPHVFGDAQAETAGDVVQKWEAIKREERQQANKPEGTLLSGVPRELPALSYAAKIQEKAAKVGFQWDDVSGAVAKVGEELAELQDAMGSMPPREDLRQEQPAEELGDVLFSLVNVARYLKIDPEAALRTTTRKFMRRFGYIESRATEAGIPLTEMSLDQMDLLWDEAKRLERRQTPQPQA